MEQLNTQPWGEDSLDTAVRRCAEDPECSALAWGKSDTVKGLGVENSLFVGQLLDKLDPCGSCMMGNVEVRSWYLLSENCMLVGQEQTPNLEF